jgi:hypothetical protein
MVKVFHILILTKQLLGYILGDFFTNSSGHSAAVTLSSGFFSSKDSEGHDETFSLQQRVDRAFFCVRPENRTKFFDLGMNLHSSVFYLHAFEFQH